MSSLATKIATAVSVGSIFLGTLATSAFADVQVFGNGAFSDNTVSTSSRNTASFSQSNNSNFNNNVSVSQNTGGNSASFNTGGNSQINTGGAYSSVDISNMGGSNSLNFGGLTCGCFSGLSGDNVSINGNGFGSRNRVNVNGYNSLNVRQNNYTNAQNRVNVRQNTGNNSSSFNTGGGFFGFGGDNTISTGDTTSGVMLHNMSGNNQFGF